ncbi:MAG TPA: MltA domain-containing protein, partial [Elusimicrobiales bacterium]|nr:MltA domain-containing protein [Elusimicrobiales bacterium]
MRHYYRQLLPAAAWPLILLLSGCSLVEKAPKYGEIPPDSALVQVSADQFPAFDDLNDKEPLLRSLKESVGYFRNQSDKRAMYTIGDKRFSAEHMVRSLEAFAKLYSQAETPEQLAKGLKKNFELYKSVGSDGKGKVVYSSYYEPILEASPVKTDKYKYPIYKRPPDLIQVSLEDFGQDKGQLYGRVEKDKLVPYFSRKEIDIDKALTGRGLELAWFEHRFDIMDLHIEGSARLKFPDGKEYRARFAGSNSLKFRGPVTA